MSELTKRIKYYKNGMKQSSTQFYTNNHMEMKSKMLTKTMPNKKKKDAHVDTSTLTEKAKTSSRHKPVNNIHLIDICK